MNGILRTRLQGLDLGLDLAPSTALPRHPKVRFQRAARPAAASATPPARHRAADFGQRKYWRRAGGRITMAR